MPPSAAGSTAEEAAAAVAACRYPRVGKRSSGLLRAALYGAASYQAEANGEIVVLGMIETKEGLANLDAICATPGLDAVYIGPADLSGALGLAPREDNPEPVHLKTCDQIRDTAHRHGIKACMRCSSAAFAPLAAATAVCSRVMAYAATSSQRPGRSLPLSRA